MKEELLPYYNHELNYLRELGVEFAQSYPEVAKRLMLEPTKCEDPHVERLLEAFSFLTARVHYKLDEEFPQITEGLLDVLFPHYIRPLPSMSIAQFTRNAAEGQSTAAEEVPRGTPVFTRNMSGTSCTFRTCYPVVLWPIEVAAASVMPSANVRMAAEIGRGPAVIRLVLKCAAGLTFAALAPGSLRFYLNGAGEVVHTLYELLFNNAIHVAVRDPSTGSETVLPAGAIGEVGFSRDEGLIPYPERSFAGYRLLQEYFSLREKFLFFDLLHLDRCWGGKAGSEIEILIALSDFERRDRMQLLLQNVQAQTFQLGCTPVINLFERTAEPIRVSQDRFEYPVVPDIHRSLTTEVYSVDRVTSVTPGSPDVVEYQPFYSLRHGQAGPEAYWHLTRSSSRRKGDKGTEVALTLVNSEFQPVSSRTEVLTVKVTCTNRDLAGQWPVSSEFGELIVEGRAGVRARFLMKPTAPQRPPLRRGLQWRLISHLSLNYLSMVEGGREAFQEILRLYNFADTPAIRAQIDGIRGISGTPQSARVISAYGVVFCQGMGVRVEFDEEAYVGAGAYLMAAVLERFFGLYSALNSFAQLTATTIQRKGVLRSWPPRAGDRILL